MAKARSLPTVEEVIALLSRSSLPTVIIEGKDDVVIYRRMEEEFGEFGLSVLPVGGRENVLKIFDQLDGSPSRDNLIFIADRDLWVISSIPESYIAENLIFTDGYSIENDVFRDLDIKSIMTDGERKLFDIEVNRFVYWYSLALKRTLEGNFDLDLSLFPSRILDHPVEYDAQTKLHPDEKYPVEILSTVEEDKFKFLRGKSLMHLASRQLTRAGRDQQIPMGSFMGMAPARRGPLLNKIFDNVSGLMT
jgi:hypothetical protein